MQFTWWTDNLHRHQYKRIRDKHGNHLPYMGRTICENTGHGKYQRHYHKQHLPPAL